MGNSADQKACMADEVAGGCYGAIRSHECLSAFRAIKLALSSASLLPSAEEVMVKKEKKKNN